MSLSEKELLLLDCFMYADIAPYSTRKQLSDVLDDFVDPKTGTVTAEKLNDYIISDNKKIQFSGDMDAEKMADVMNQMRESEALMKLKITHVTEEYEGSIRAACFYDADTQKATVAFRGTGGSYQQWSNNLEAYGDVSNPTQRDAVAFIKSLPYTDIDVTGHSNGGNQAMYVTIVCGNKVTRCVSFEGQGVSEEFFQQYGPLIAEHKDKIKNINAYNDPVNTLLPSIAGETIYVKSNNSLFSHGAYTILIANEFDTDGNFSDDSIIEQSRLCKLLHTVTVSLASYSDIPIAGNLLEYITDFSGIVVGLVISGDFSKLDGWYKAFTDYVKSNAEYLLGLAKDVKNIVDDAITFVHTTYKTLKDWYNRNFNIGYQYSLSHPRLVVNTYKLEQYAQQLRDVNKRINKLDKRLDALYWKVGLLGLWNLMQADLFTGYSWRLNQCADYLSDTADEFENIENELLKYLI